MEQDPLQDLCQLFSVARSQQKPSPPAEAFAATIRNRFLAEKTTTYVSPFALVSINPNKPVQTNAESVVWDYITESWATQPETLPPHVWQLATRAYYYLRRTGQDQTIVLNGKTASGKSECRRLILKALVDVASPQIGKKGSKLSIQIPSAQFLLESFGHATTLYNPNASLFGRYVEVQYGERSRIIGCKTLQYHMDKTRASGAPRGERNFHIFHYLLAGATPEEAAHLKLDVTSAGGFKVLGGMSYPTTSKSDSAKFAQVKEAFRQLSFSKRAVSSICQILAAILHLGQLEFHSEPTQDAAVVSNWDVLEHAASLLGVEPEALQSALSTRTRTLGHDRVSAFLDEEGAARNRDELSRAIYGLLFSWISDFLNNKLNRDDFQSFISILDLPGIQNGGGVTRPNGLDDFCFNLANERLHSFMQRQIYEKQKDDYEQEEVAEFLSGLNIDYSTNTDCERILTARPGGLVHIIDDQSSRKGKNEHTMLEAMGRRWENRPSFGWRAGNERLGRTGSFVVSHYDGQVTYSAENFVEENRASISTDFVQLFGGVLKSVPGPIGSGPQKQLAGGSRVPMVQELFESEATAAAAEAAENGGGLKPKSTLRARPSMRRKQRTGSTDEKADEILEDNPTALLRKASKRAPMDQRTVVGAFNEDLTTLFDTLSENRLWLIMCLKPNEAGLPNQCDLRLLRSQVGALGLAETARRLDGEWAVSLTHQEWWDRYTSLPQLSEAAAGFGSSMWPDKLKGMQSEMEWTNSDMAVGKHKVFLSHAAFRLLEDRLRAQEDNEMRMLQEKQQQALEANSGMVSADPFGPSTPASPEVGKTLFANPDTAGDQTAVLPLVGHQQSPSADSPWFADDDQKSYMDARPRDLETSTVGPASTVMYNNNQSNMFDGEKPEGNPYNGEEPEKSETVETVRQTNKRRLWVFMTWCVSWFIPNFALHYIGRMKRKDVRMAWREKLLINVLIWLVCAATIFVILFLGNLICPKEPVFTLAELQNHGWTEKKSYTAIRGEVFDITDFAEVHSPSIVPSQHVKKYAGRDASALFPVQVSALCNGVGDGVSPWVTLPSTNSSEDNAVYHDFRFSTTLLDPRPDWYMEQMIYLRWNYRKGFRGWTHSDVSKLSDKSDTSNTVIYEGNVYDMTTYIQNSGGIVASPDETDRPRGIERKFMHDNIVSLFETGAGSDITDSLNALNLDPAVLAAQKTCMRNLFFVGKVDTRGSASCQFSRWILLAISLIMVVIIFVKFLAALNFSSSKVPEEAEKFVILQLPCYTEGDESIRKSLESLAALKYDDRRKLIWVVCDGNIIGSGNEKSTPEIVLDILGADPTADPEPLSFISLGDGNKQHNMAKVYSGLYEHAGHIVPYIVFVKVGKPTERSKPGNRGKRDSQMIVMNFLNKIHHDAPMAPAELELTHQIKNVIGVNPSFYEFLLSIDADTGVDQHSLSRMIARMMRDRRVIGLCGETSLANPKRTIVSMLQVYEYWISHHMTKAFESLFGSVTCLPGCFSLFRIKTIEQKPLLCNSAIIEAFGVNVVDTLHLKNLLHLGEDRYLTTLLLKNFPTYKTVFVRDAYAKTVAPDDTSVLLSQRRRWINSTVHNLFELMMVEGLCGFCCFSMRFVVLVDLISTFVAPVTCVYLGYLLYVIISEGGDVPMTAILMLAAIYGLQAIVFILHGAFEMVGWLVIYICAIPLFSFIIPIYSFWKMDDFSWGNTRVIEGERGKRRVVHEEGKFDPSEIPLKTWAEYEAELWEKGSNQSIGSIIAGNQRGYAAEDDMSAYGPASVIGSTPGSRDASGYFGAAGAFSQDNLMAGAAPYAGAPHSSPGMMDNASAYGFNQFGTSSPGQARMSTDPFFSPQHQPMFSMASSPGSPPEPPAPGMLPSEERLVWDIQQLVSISDLNVVSKKMIRNELASRYGVPDLGPLRPLADRTTEEAAANAA